MEIRLFFRHHAGSPDFAECETENSLRKNGREMKNFITPVQLTGGPTFRSLPDPFKGAHHVSPKFPSILLQTLVSKVLGPSILRPTGRKISGAPFPRVHLANKTSYLINNGKNFLFLGIQTIQMFHMALSNVQRLQKAPSTNLHF